MNITLIQTTLYWEVKEENILHFTELIDGITEETDLIVLPEMFATGFSMETSALAEKMTGPVIGWMKTMAAKKQAAICGSLIIEEHAVYYNRFIWVNPDGSMHTYNKRHLFRMTEEDRFYTKGTERIMISYKGFRIFPLVCYDLRFPVWLRRTKAFDYDLMLVVANWPERRSAHWKNLLQARAIENQCYVAGVNRVGDDGKGFHYTGDSALIGPTGEIIFQLANEAFVKTFTLDTTAVNEWRQAFPAIEDADPFTLE